MLSNIESNDCGCEKDYMPGTEGVVFVNRDACRYPAAVARIAELEYERNKATEEMEKHNAASANALELLWQEILIANHPDYGEWEYPGQAYRHIKAEYNDLCAERDGLRKLVERVMPLAEIATWNLWVREAKRALATTGGQHGD